MKSAVIVFPGSNCDRDVQIALKTSTNFSPTMVWHKDGEIPANTDLIVIPGGFSYGDYLRCGAIAANSNVNAQIRKHAERGGYILGICNGFQILCEMKLLPGMLIRNKTLKFICNSQRLEIANFDTAFTWAYSPNNTISIPIAHSEGNFFADDDTLSSLEGENRVVFRYIENPNGSARNIAGIMSPNGRILGMMPHPERAIGVHEGGTDGINLFNSLKENIT